MEVPRLWRQQKQRYRLQGATCPQCGARLFPQRAVCPYCAEERQQVSQVCEAPYAVQISVQSMPEAVR